MVNSKFLLNVVAVGVTGLAPLVGQSPHPPLPTADSPAAVPAVEPVPVWIIGASLSRGFVDPVPRADGSSNSSIPLARALRRLWADGTVDFTDQSEQLSFLNPEGAQTRKLRKLAESAPALVLGLDFPFWFGYGRVRGDELEARLKLQATGLAMLDGLEMPIVLGDYPDMTGADPRMLAAAQIPSAQARAALNAGLERWAAERPDVFVFPLARFVAATKSEGLTEAVGTTELHLDADALLQGDRLHPTRLGMAVLAKRLADFVRERLPADHPLRPAERSFLDFVEDAGAGSDLDLAREATHEAEAVEVGPAESGPGRCG